MSRMLALFLACLLPGMALAETVVPLTVGGTEVRIAVDDGYLRTSEHAPEMHAITAAALPPGNRLIEAFMSPQDAKRFLLQQKAQDIYLQVQVLRKAEAHVFSDAEWREGRPLVAQQLGALDMRAILSAQQDDAGKRMSALSGAKVDVRFGDPGKPVLYGSDQDSALRFVMLTPVTVMVNDKQEQLLLECAGAVVVLNGKLLYLYAYRNHEPGADTTIVRAALDRFVDRALVLNAAASTE